MKVRKLNEKGLNAYFEWLNVRKRGEAPPVQLLDDEHTLPCLDCEIDVEKQFDSRFAFGGYISAALVGQSPKIMLDVNHDAMWNWITIVYFSQFGRKPSKYWYYAVTRTGLKTSLDYRHLARSSYAMFTKHGENSKVVLSVPMDTGGDMAEALTSRQNIANHTAAFATAVELYWYDGAVRTGAADKVTDKNVRKPGEFKGRGGARRLGFSLRRLALTYDTHAVEPKAMVQLLPREFVNFVARSDARPSRRRNQRTE